MLFSTFHGALCKTLMKCANRPSVQFASFRGAPPVSKVGVEREIR
jgi:hypothetical protein